MKKIMFVLAMVAATAFIAAQTAVAGGEDSNHPHHPSPATSPQYYANCIALPAALPSPAGSIVVDNDLATDIVMNGGGKFWIGQRQIGPPGPSLAMNVGNPDLVFVPGSWIAYSLTNVPCAAGAAATFMALPVRGVYCAVTGNTHPFTGAAIPTGKALDLLAGQPGQKGSTYVGATPANFVDGVDSKGRYIGLTCDAPPAGYVRKGTAGDAQHVSSEPGYPLWVRG